MKKSALLSLLLFCLLSSCVFASDKSWYFSWGYNKDYWSNSDIHISQPALNNHFTVYDASASDDPGWTTGIFNKSLMSPQYNIRIGHFINAAQTWGIELSFDHTKYNTNLYQSAYIAGVINGKPINQNEILTPQYFNYALHNGANELMLNMVRRHLFAHYHHVKLALIGKFGAGVMLPHPENTILGNTVDVGPKTFSNSMGWNHGWWQMGGWTAGLEGGFQSIFYDTVFLELTDKEAYTHLSDIQIYDGTAHQTMWLNEVIMNGGVLF